jgi:hypothetical protein
MKFVLLVEGATEKQTAGEFIKRWLDPQLTRSVGVQVVGFHGYAELARKLVPKALSYLESPRADEIIAVIGLLDLYGPDFYPRHADTAKKRHEWGVAHFQKRVNHPQFRMFFAVHEFEAWLLGDPSIFPASIRDALPARVAEPEKINFNEPPSKLLNNIYRQKTKGGYKKTTYGKTLFAKLDPAAALARCPYLKAMLNEMLNLAKAAGL